MSNYHQKSIALCLGLMAFAMTGSSRADEFTKADVQRFQEQFMTTVAQGREL
jgi:thiosulfate dehydrogenase